MTLTTYSGTITASSAAAPRLRMEPTGSAHTLLDGGWWPRTTDPAAEVPGLVLAIDKIRGQVTRLVLSAQAWDPHPRRLVVADRVLRLGYFSSQPTALLTAQCDNGNRVDLLVVPPNTASDTADAAMVLAATTSNVVHAQRLVATAAGTSPTRMLDGPAEQAWETDGGSFGGGRVPR